MKRILFISNICRKISNFHLVSQKSANEMGYEFHFAANFCEMSKEEKEKHPNIIFHQIDFVRFPFHPGNRKAHSQLTSLIKEISFDAIHCNTPIGGALGRICGRKRGIDPIIYTAHGFHFYKGAPLFNRTILKWAEMIMAHWTDVIITMNQEDYEAAKKFKLRNNGKVYYVPGVGIDTDDYKNIVVDKNKIRSSLGLKNSDIVCISMGDLIPRKNYGVAIKAIAKCKNPYLHYLICGKGPELENLKKLAKKENIESQIHFLGFRTDIKELLKASDIFLFTTLQEGMPRSMMEAMASGLPCIASRIRGNVDLLEDEKGGFLVPVDDVDTIAEKLNVLASNAELRKKMSERNLVRILDFDTVKVKEIIGKIYREEIG